LLILGRMRTSVLGAAREEEEEEEEEEKNGECMKQR
jgi:hypothetical protein